MSINVLIILVIACWVLVGFCFATWLIAAAIRRLAWAITWPWRITRSVEDSERRIDYAIDAIKRAAAADGPVPYRLDDSAIDALAAMVMCPLCCPGGRGLCICPEDCGHPACVFAHVDLTPLSEAEERYLHGRGEMP